MSLYAELPNGKKILPSDSIMPYGNFYWREATANLTRIPQSQLVVDNIIYVAAELEHYRYILGNKPIYISSWYRPPEANKKAGGATNSRHLFGDAVDFRHQVLSPKEVYEILDSKHTKGGLSAYRTHVHIDFRGYKCRW